MDGKEQLLVQMDERIAKAKVVLEQMIWGVNQQRGGIAALESLRKWLAEQPDTVSDPDLLSKIAGNEVKP